MPTRRAPLASSSSVASAPLRTANAHRAGRRKRSRSTETPGDHWAIKRPAPRWLQSWVRMTDALVVTQLHAVSAARVILAHRARPVLMGRALRQLPPKWVQIVSIVASITSLMRAPPASVEKQKGLADPARCRRQDKEPTPTVRRFGSAHSSYQTCGSCHQMWKWAPDHARWDPREPTSRGGAKKTNGATDPHGTRQDPHNAAASTARSREPSSASPRRSHRSAMAA